MSWIEDLKKRAAEKRDRAVRSAGEEYRREMSMIDELAARLDSNGHGQGPVAPEPFKPATTSTEALREAFARLPATFTREEAFAYVREYYPALARDLSSAFNKLRQVRKEITLAKAGHGSTLPVFRRVIPEKMSDEHNENAPGRTGA